MLGPVRVGAVEIAGIGAMGMTEIDTVGTAKTGAKGMAETSVTSATREVAISIFAIRGMDMQNKGRPQQKGDTDTYV